jgi:protein phosphatase
MPPQSDRKPKDQEIDAYGLTHVGRARSTNQDHFLIASLRKHVVVHHTSLPNPDALSRYADRVAFVSMVADGAGGEAGGEEASRQAVAAVTRYVTESMECFYNAPPGDDVFHQALHEAAMRCHATLLDRAEEDRDLYGMATTLTLWLGIWPRAYLLQVGDSRCYLLQQGELSQITRDQTMAQELVDLGVMSQSDASTTKLAHTLSSSIGGRQSAPVVTRLDAKWGNVALLCSDGLTNHVSDERIGERLRSMTSAKQVCEDLLEEALAGGGTDNITLIVGRALPGES